MRTVSKILIASLLFMSFEGAIDITLAAASIGSDGTQSSILCFHNAELGSDQDLQQDSGEHACHCSCHGSIHLFGSEMSAIYKCLLKYPTIVSSYYTRSLVPPIPPPIA